MSPCSVRLAVLGALVLALSIFLAPSATQPPIRLTSSSYTGCPVSPSTST